MPTYLVVSQAPGAAPAFDAVTAASTTAASQAIRDQYAQGLSVNADGSRDQIRIGLIELDAWGTITPTPIPGQVPVTTFNPRAKQAAIADLGTLTVTSTAQANTAIQTIRTLINTLLAELRAAQIIDP